MPTQGVNDMDQRGHRPKAVELANGCCQHHPMRNSAQTSRRTYAGNAVTSHNARSKVCEQWHGNAVPMQHAACTSTTGRPAHQYTCMSLQAGASSPVAPALSAAAGQLQKEAQHCQLVLPRMRGRANASCCQSPSHPGQAEAQTLCPSTHWAAHVYERALPSVPNAGAHRTELLRRWPCPEQDTQVVHELQMHSHAAVKDPAGLQQRCFCSCHLSSCRRQVTCRRTVGQGVRAGPLAGMASPGACCSRSGGACHILGAVLLSWPLLRSAICTRSA